MHADSPGGRSTGEAARGFEHVSSPANDTIKLLRSLDRKKTRAETGLFLAEGARHAEEALARGWKPAYAVAGLPALERPQTVDLLKRLGKSGARVLTGSQKVMEALARKDNPQTVITAFAQQTTELDALPVDGARRFMALYEIRDPGNLGTVLRTSDAAGVDGVILIGNCCDPFSVEAVRASMGSLFAMKLAETDWETFDLWRKAAGARVVAASMHGVQRHDETTYGERSIVLMGNEQAGLPRNVEDSCDALVRIPMRGAADSLNVAIAASVMIYEAWRAAGYSGAEKS